MSNHAPPGEFETTTIGGVAFRLWPATRENSSVYAARPAIEDWLVKILTRCYEGDEPLSVLLVGPPGTGKSMIAAAVSRRLGLPFFRWGGHNSLRAEDLICLGRIREDQGIEPVLSPVASGCVRGGLVFLDDVDKCTDESLSALLPLLDGAGTLPTTLGAAELPIHPDARFIFAANELSHLPQFFRSRLVKVEVPYLPIDQTLQLVKQSGAIPHAEVVVCAFREAWLAHAPKERASPSLRECVRGCRALGKASTDKPDAVKDPGVQAMVVKAVIEQ